jgi:hypothetical protein
LCIEISRNPVNPVYFHSFHGVATQREGALKLGRNTLFTIRWLRLSPQSSASETWFLLNRPKTIAAMTQAGQVLADTGDFLLSRLKHVDASTGYQYFSARSCYFPRCIGVGSLSIKEFAKQSVSGQGVHHRE